MNGKPTLTVLFTLWALGMAPDASAQDLACDRNLSTLESDVAVLAVDLQQADGRMRSFMAAVDDLDHQAMRPDVCPEGMLSQTSQQRGDISAMTASEIVRRSQLDLDCAQSFVARVSGDIEKAQQENNSALVVRLNSISKRILELDSRATELAMGASHLASRQTRLLAALDIVDGHCSSMDSIYE